MKDIRSFLRAAASAAAGIVLARATPGDAQFAPRIPPPADTFYETNYGSSTIKLFSARGRDLGVLATLTFPTGLALDGAGNVYVASDDPAEYSIQKIAPDGAVSVFAKSGLNGPHALAFDKAGNLYVANIHADTIERFTPAGAGTVFADANDGLEHPIDLVFDKAGNLYVSNAFGGPAHTGSVLKFAPGGVGSVFAENGFHLAYGLALDRAGNLYVSNLNSNTIEKFSPNGTDLGLFASTGLNSPHGMVFDRAGNLYVANNGNQTIERFSSAGVDLGVFARTQSGPHFIAILRASRRTENQ